MSDELICGRPFKVVKPIIHPKTVYKGKKPYNKIVVEGVNHPKGKPIRFKSRDNAERHIRNMGLEVA